MAALADLGHALAIWLLWMSLWTVALFAGARLADLATRRIVAARWRYLYYLAVPVRLLFPVAWSAPLAIGNASTLGGAAVISPVRVAGASPFGPVGIDGGAFDAFALVLPVHLLVAAALAFLWWRAHRRLVRAAREGTVGPAVIGLLRPRIVLPRSPLPVDGRDRVLAHEQAHMARRDPFVSALMRLICLLLWPVLPLTFAARRVRLLMEIACDDRALHGATPAERNTYMRTLYTLSLMGRSSPSPAFGAGRGLTARIREASRPSRAPTGLQIVIALLLPALLLGCAGLGASRSDAVDSVEFIEIVPRLVSNTDGDARQVFVMSAMLDTDESPTLDAPFLTKAGEDAWIVAESNACMSLFPRRDFTTVSGPSLVLTSGSPGIITCGRTAGDGSLEAGIRLEITATPDADDAVKLSVRFVQRQAGAETRVAEVAGVLVPRRDSLFLRTRSVPVRSEK